MSTLQYTSIPDTSDRNYWQAKGFDTKTKTSTFVPRDKELHRSLLEKEWKHIQARNRRKTWETTVKSKRRI
ncbi:hypothetical protein GCM10027592_63250 [Spirosoma flavus]